jgi:hypothetical protein
VLRVLGQPEAREEIRIPVELLERVIAAVDPVAVSRQGDPWLYFYEDFLAAYDEKLRKNRGVYYTPAEVVGVQVRLVAELLAKRFGKPLTFVDDEVTLLDPAAGTGAYPLAAMTYGLDQVRRKFGQGAVGTRATHAARNIHAFEILVGPYAVAHLRLSQQVLDADGSLPDDGVHVYLTDTLESPHHVPRGQQMFDLLHRRLSEEAARARAVKADTRILVCIGNPPYYRQLIGLEERGVERLGGWIRYGDHGDDGILSDFMTPVRAAGGGIHLKNLYNLYVYFWRWALWKVFESTYGSGIVCFITASSYLRGPGFAGMRQVMRATFDELWIIDLEGHSRAPRKTENVFAIANPVAIAIGVRTGAPNTVRPALVWYTRLTGNRRQKLDLLSKVSSFRDLDWSECFGEWQAPFLPREAGDYFRWPLLTDVFPWQYSGVQFKRTWPIGPTRDVLRARWKALLETPRDERGAALRETAARRVTEKYRNILPPFQALAAIEDLDRDGRLPELRRYGFRSFDRQWALVDPRLCDRPRPVLWQVHGPRQIYMTSLLTEVLGIGPAATVTALVPDLHHFCNFNGAKHVIPLWRDPDGTNPNVTSGILGVLTSVVGTKVSPEDLLAYCYALLAAPEYVERFSEELTNPGPRVPLTKEPRLFRNSVQLGRQLIRLHTYGESFNDGRAELLQGRARCTKAVSSSRTGYPTEYSYDSAEHTLYVGDGHFSPVSPKVWSYAISGFEVVQWWLGYRMAQGAGRASSPLDRVRPERWTADMTEELLRLLWILETTLALEPRLNKNLASVVASETLADDDLPQPSLAERAAPAVRSVHPEQLDFEI